MRRYTRITPLQTPTAVALGCFDGVHLGHARVLQSALRGRRGGLSPAVFTFATGGKDCAAAKQALALMSPQAKEEEFRRMGFDLYLAVDFASVRELTPEQFVRDVLFGALRAKRVSCGFNYHFGRGGTGNSALLRALCAQYGIRTEICDAVEFCGAPVSSTRIREAVAAGDMELARRMLGRPFRVDFEVVRGNRIGRLLGTPTINQPFPASFVLPKFGVYGSSVLVDGKRYHGVTNVGVKPTVGSHIPLAETWIAGFQGDLYGRRVPVDLLGFLRPEKKFADLTALREQILRDAEQAKLLWAQMEKGTGF